jgi:hypothetical protein
MFTRPEKGFRNVVSGAFFFARVSFCRLLVRNCQLTISLKASIFSALLLSTSFSIWLQGCS